MPGAYFIALEGIDGSGTTTQAAAVTRALEEAGHRVFQTRQPSQGVIGRLIRQHLAVDAEPLDPAALALLFAADRLEHLDREIEPALADGQVVVCDRYVLSSWAYQSLDCPLEWVRQINGRARWPDLTILVDVDPAVGLARVSARQASGESTPEFFEVPETQRRLAATYRDLAVDPSLENIVVVDGTAAAQAVTASILGQCKSAGL